MIIVNPSKILEWSWNVVEKFIDEEAASKISFLSSKKFPPMPETIDPNIF